MPKPQKTLMKNEKFYDTTLHPDISTIKQNYEIIQINP